MAFPTYSALDFVTRALTLLGVYQPGEAIAAEDAETAFNTLQELVDSWANERLTIFRLLRTVQTLTSGVASYTIGVGGTINIARPQWIQDAGLIIDTTASVPTEIPIDVLDDDAYAAISQKTLPSGYVQGVYLDHAWSAGLANLKLFPVPNIGTTQLVLYTPLALTTFADLTTGYTFPPGYPRALRYNLAMECAADFPGAEVPPAVQRLAVDSKANIKRANSRLSTVMIDPSLRGSPAGMSASRFVGGTF